MRAGYLSQFFEGVAAKRLSGVEANPAQSNQHEFNGVQGLKSLFGSEIKREVSATFLYLSDNDDPLTADGNLTWYDARERNPQRSEYRLYFQQNQVMARAAEGDLLLVAKQTDGRALVLVAQGGSTIANQVLWLFGVDPNTHPGFSVREDLETDRDRIGFFTSFILDQIGVNAAVVDESYLEDMLSTFGGRFPPTKLFSEFARNKVHGADPAADPDGTLVAWMDREETLFRTLEKHLVLDRLKVGFADDVDGFLSYSLTVQNRRKSRAGLALEHHVQAIFDAAHLKYDRTPLTEGRSRPDFLFPGATAYTNFAFDSSLLTMLGVKSTCKERWRQVLAEADRVERKHLLTLEAAVSENQTEEMVREKLQLVVPRGLHSTFTAAQRGWILDVAGFIRLAQERQRRAELPL